MVGEYLSKTLFLIFWGVYPEEGSVDHSVTLLPSRGTPTLFPMVATPLTIPTHRHRSSDSSTSLPTPVTFYSGSSHRNGHQRSPVGLLCVALVMSGVGSPLMRLLASGYLL